MYEKSMREIPVLSAQGVTNCVHLNSKVRTGERSTVKLISLVGHSRNASRGTFKADLVATTLDSLWDEVCKAAKSKTGFRFSATGSIKGLQV